MTVKVYVYKNCGTCRKALNWLDAKGVEYVAVPIRETPPTQAELKKMLGYYDGDVKKLFNTSGVDYRELKLKDTLPGMSTKEAIALLNSNGNLVKRPFLLAGSGGTVGFNEAIWETLLGSNR